MTILIYSILNIGQRIFWCNSCYFNISMLEQLNDGIGGLLHLGPNVITFRALLHLGPNVITVFPSLEPIVRKFSHGKII